VPLYFRSVFRGATEPGHTSLKVRYFRIWR